MSYQSIARIGVDVGGTHTDATLLVNGSLVAQFKAATSPDVTAGVVQAISGLLNNTQFPKSQIKGVNIGTTHLVNACIQKKGLNQIMTLRLSGKATTALPPGSDWSQELKEQIIGQDAYIIDGGFEYDGKEIAPINPNQIKSAISLAVQKKIEAVAVIGIFANVNRSQEEEVKALFNNLAPSIHITLSHTMGGLGLLARENATIINATTITLYQKISRAFKDAMKLLQLPSQVYLTYGDGTKTNLEDPTITPLRTFHSGPVNSINGAGILANIKNAVTIDIGGTSSDIGILREGKPVFENSSFPMTGLGVNCNFILPRLNSFGLGGGSVIRATRGDVRIGPDSLGHDLYSKALVFGGNTLTPTDIAVVLGRFKVGTVAQQELKRKIALFADNENVDAFIKRIDQAMHKKLIEGIQTTVDAIENIPETLILVGGGALLFDLESLKNRLSNRFKTVIIPESGGIANALGAGMSRIGAKFVQVYNYDNISRDSAISEAIEKAKRLAIAKGASAQSVSVVNITETPINYLKGQPHETSVSVIGDDADQSAEQTQQPFSSEIAKTSYIFGEPEILRSHAPSIATSSTQNSRMKGVISLSPTAVADIAIGAGLLGSGGGGSPTLGLQLALNALKRGEAINKISLDDLPDDAFVVVFGVMGSPVVVDERPPAFDEGVAAIRAFEKKSGKKVDAIALLEGGGMNCTYPLFVAAALGIPIVDADCMGRAFPGINMVTPNIYGEFNEYYAALSNGRETILIEGASNFATLEENARKATIELGGIVSIAYMPMTGAQAKKWTIKGTLSTVENMGRAIRESEGQAFSQKLNALNKVLALTDYKKAIPLFEGTIVKVICNSREVVGFNVGGFVIENPQTLERIEIGFQNENLIALTQGSSKIIAQVPDLITIVDPNNVQAISCGEYRFGQQVVVLTLKAPSLMMTEKALAVVGPSAYPMEQILKLVGNHTNQK